MRILAYAKINLSLEIVGRRADGYHELVSVMQRISLSDTLCFERSDGGLFLDTHGALPADDSNLILRAAHAYFAAAGESFGVKIELEKKIPMKAGLGGGSADAAATLLALNALAGERFTVDELCAIGAGIGADVPFCVRGGTQICRGIGERMEPIENNLAPFVVVAMGERGVSTPRAFAALDEAYGDFAGFDRLADEGLSRLTACLKNADSKAISAAVFNRFEHTVSKEVPEVLQIKADLLAGGAFAAQMSGSGPSVFGLFDSAQSAEKAAKTLEKQGKTAFVCRFQ